MHISSKVRLTPQLFIEVPVPSQEGQRSCICVLGVRGHVFVLVVSILPLSTILIFDFGIVLTVIFFFSFYYLDNKDN